MNQLQVTYDGEQHCTALQEAKGKSVATDCPYTGKGEELSPKELVGAGLAGCMLISMGTLAKRSELDITGTRVEVDISFETDKADARISAIELIFNMPQNFSDKDRTRLERAAGMCPIKPSFHPDIPISVQYNYPG